MPAIVKLSLEDLAEIISSLNLEEKLQLQEIIEHQIFEAEEAIYEDNDETIDELQSVRTELVGEEFVTMEEYLTSRNQAQSSTHY